MSTYAFRLTAGALSLLSTLPALSLAQSADAARTAGTVSALTPVVVTASRTPQPLDTVLGDVTVIDHETLQNSKSSSLAEILSRQPGVQIYTNGGPQTVTGVFLRGTNPAQTLVLLDGVRINDANTGSVNWNALDPSVIERVEILRGAASSLYGADAIGGVINIITRPEGQNEYLNTWANIGFGTHSLFKSSLGVSGAQNQWDYRFSASTASSNGFNATTPDNGTYNPDRDGYEQHAISGVLGYTWQPGQHIGLSLYNGYIDGDYDSGPSIVRSHTITRQQSYSLTSTNQITDFWQSVARFGISKSSLDDRSGYPYAAAMLQRQYSWQNNFLISENQSLSLLAERLEERLSHDTAFNLTRRQTNSAAVVYRANLDKHHFQASLRHDRVSAVDNETTGSAAYAFDFAPHWQTGLAANTGFKLPSFSQMFYPGSSNADLKPEKSRNIEAHLRYDDGTLGVNATIYQNKVRDLIVNDATWTPYNLEKATIRGLTLSSHYQWNDTSLRASADLLRPRNDSNGRTLERRSRQVYNLGIDHRIGQLLLGADYQFRSHSYSNANNTQRLGGYGLLNLRAAYDFTRQVGVQFYWNNVLDKDYTQAYGYRNDGSNVFVNLSWKY